VAELWLACSQERRGARRAVSAFTARVRLICSADQSNIEAWPFESTKRSRLGQIGFSGSKRRTRF
jgi:hypothetical protein